MKPSAAFALSALLSLAMTQPMVEKRDDYTTTTITDVVVVTTDVTITVGPSPAPAAVTSKHAGHIAYHAQGKAEAQAKPALSSSSSPPQQPAPVEQKAAVYQAPPASPSSAPAPPAGSSPEQIQAAEDAKQEDINAKQKQADFAHQSQMIAQQNGGSTPAPAAPSPAPASPAPQAPAQSQAPPPSSGGGSSGGSCGSVGGSCSGDVTIYNDQGTGACGWNNDTNSEDFFALAHGMFGDYTNDAPGPHKNAFCGRMASIQVNGNSYNGMLTDKCGGCDGQSIDLSQHLFSQLYPNEPPGNGRYYNVQWKFTSGPIYSQG